jgi:hypothetical protein
MKISPTRHRIEAALLFILGLAFVAVGIAVEPESRAVGRTVTLFGDIMIVFSLLKVYFSFK